MAQYILYNDDVRVAQFSVSKSVISEYFPERPELLPMQIRRSTAEGFSSWLRERAVDLNSVQHRNLMNELLGSRDKTILALRTHMFSISDIVDEKTKRGEYHDDKAYTTNCRTI